MVNHLANGKLAETLALKYLQRQGLKLIAQNWRSSYGEIDLIMQLDKTLVFIEVRYRQQNHWGTPAETITSSKQNKIITTAQLFLQKNARWAAHPCRFDVISIADDINNPCIEWLANAFSIH